MITGERGIKKKITRKLKQHNHDRHYNIHKSQGKTSTTLQYPKITRKTSTTKARATHNEDRRYNIPLNLLLLATRCKVHCGPLGALWVHGWFVTKRWRVYCSDTRVGE